MFGHKSEIRHSLFLITLEHLLFVPLFLLIPGEVQNDPHKNNILHVHVEVQVSPDQLRVLVLVLLVGEQLGDEHRQIVLDEGITRV